MELDDDEGLFGGLYENGRWLWDEKLNRMIFLSNLRPKTIEDLEIYTYTETSGAIEFREDVDLIEQMRYRRRFQRKLEPGQANIITLQDVKDLVIYTAPINFLSAKLINMLHTPTAERFLRALILYCAYSIQVTDEMLHRTLELDLKVRTPDSERIEEEYRDNLADLRMLVAKEYCTILVGAGDMKTFHHMGPLKKRRSLLAKDARSFETFIRLSVQIVYLAMGRRYFRQIELETHRLLKSEIFNAVEHKSHAVKAQAEQLPIPKSILLGRCVRHQRQLNIHSPLMNEVFCARPADYRMKGLGVVKYNLTPRLRFLFLAFAGPEEAMAAENIIIGIIGMQRTLFDTMLRLLPPTPIEAKSKAVVSRQSVASGNWEKSQMGMKKSRGTMWRFPEIIIPPKESVETVVPKEFTDELEDIPPVSEHQRRLWQQRFNTMIKLLTKRRRHCCNNK